MKITQQKLWRMIMSSSHMNLDAQRQANHQKMEAAYEAWEKLYKKVKRGDAVPPKVYKKAVDDLFSSIKMATDKEPKNYFIFEIESDNELYNPASKNNADRIRDVYTLLRHVNTPPI